MTLIILAITISLIVGFGVGVFIFKPRLDVARARLADAENVAARQREDFGRALENLESTFKGVSSDVLKESRDEFMKQAEPKLAAQIKPLEDALKRNEELFRAVEGKREEAYGGIASHLKILQEYTHKLKEETGNLRSALKSPVVRGQWGEVTLRRVVEIAGMSEYCDFEEQKTAVGDDARSRPDMIVKLPGNRTIVVDAKTPRDPYIAAMEAVDDKARASFLNQHAQAVRDHMRRLGQKPYLSQFEPTPDFVVMFLPGESLFAAALEIDRKLIEDGMENKVIIATPTTLIALLRSVAMGWKQEQLAKNAQQISIAGKDLFDRFVKFSEHLSKIRQGLDNAVKSFNGAMRSWESRVLPGARKLKELGATRGADTPVPEIEPIETIPLQIADGETAESEVQAPPL